MYCCRHHSKYGFWKFIGDLLLTAITGGLWLIFIFVREMRRNNKSCHR